MDSLLLDVIKNVPFTLAVLVIFYLLMNNVIKNSSQQQTSSDGLMNRLIDSYAKMVNVVESLKDVMAVLNTNVSALERTINERNILIESQGKLLDDLDKKVSELLGKDDAKIQL